MLFKVSYPVTDQNVKMETSIIEKLIGLWNAFGFTMVDFSGWFMIVSLWIHKDK